MAANSDEFKGTGDDYHEPGPIFRGVLMALAVIGTVCLTASFLKDPVGWQDVAALGLVAAAAVYTGRALLRLLSGKAKRRGRG